MIKILLFAKFREVAQSGKIEIEFGESKTVKELKNYLLGLDTFWHDILNNPKLIVAVNQSQCGDEQIVHNNDEVAFYPPVSGG